MKTGLIFCVIFVVTLPLSAHAEGYNFYVDNNYSGEGDGSSEKPFSKISEAIEKSLEKNKGSRKIYVRNGEYDESIALGEFVEIYGQDKNKTIIKNSATESASLKNNNVLNNLTILGGVYGIIIKGEAKIVNCIVKNTSNTAIQILPGTAKVTIEKTKISGNIKGIYVQTGRSVSIINNEIYNNKGEGVDLRDKIKGTIAGNSIYSNKEGGIELLVGSSNLMIKNNNIKKNNSSGIANQFYDIAKKCGKVQIMDNIISQNREYGITCGTPSGGYPGKNYWENSLSILKNKIENNGKKAIAGRCGIINAVNPEVKETNQIIESESAKNEDPEQSTDGVINSAEEAEMIQKNSEIKSQMEEIILQFNNAEIVAQNNATKIKERSKIKIFLVGNNKKDVASLENEIQAIKSLADKIRNLSQETQSEENKSFANDSIRNLETKVVGYESLVQQSKNKFSLFGWLIKYF